ncbi:hypothetical protein MPL1032_130167 [Mesorhizobium plurifarium]|uniref:Uncharacterized protein n=1 Tax=Mesorhizobium plurifarium TaxID=69974 RepID=A0A0K2VR89_MESPL|nr:hypothetical protein MPL1032_130167 [Mesorhizobium plurifarium]
MRTKCLALRFAYLKSSRPERRKHWEGEF